ncbi:MAG: hypothetical protein EXR49_02920 [Dehalococcoidia bacterium]|nr:hypothetical protein [Dehalococcoidia bacterium]
MHRAAQLLTNSKYRGWRMGIAGTICIVYAVMHVLTYIPAMRPVVDNLPYFRLHVLHKAEVLLIVVYAGLALRWRFGISALVLTALTSIPFILTPYIFGRAPRVDELRDQSI